MHFYEFLYASVALGPYPDFMDPIPDEDHTLLVSGSLKCCYHTTKQKYNTWTV
jgi:hypothetical protein